MKIIPLAACPPRERTNNARPGKYDYYQLTEGDEASPDNFTLQLVRTYGDMYSPRHCHNFDQIRMQLEGGCDFSRDGLMKVGTVGYFPESTPYGPQTNVGESFLLLLQFGGASGNGYISERTYDRAVRELKQTGEFQEGSFTAPGKPKTDAFQAVWEHASGRPIQYAPTRYATAVFMEPTSFAWTPAPQAPGALIKTLGIFSEREVGIRLAQLEPGASLPLAGRSIAFVVAGKGSCGTEPLELYSTIELNTGEHATLKATNGLEILLIQLPPARAARASETATATAESR